MKAFKLASAFAVTGLALAVSGQAMAADTTTEWTWDGKVTFSADLMNNNTALENAKLSNGVVGERGANHQNAYNLDVVVGVANGGFSADLALEKSNSVVMKNFLYEEGAFMFGEIGSVVTTEAAIKGMNSDQAYTSDKGFRYTAGGLQVQAFGGASYTSDASTASTYTAAGGTTGQGPYAATDMGLEFAFTGSTDTVTYAVDAQYAEDTMGAGAATDAALDMYMGVNVSAMASDAVTIDAGYTSGFGGETSTALMATYAADALTAYVRWNDNSGASDTTIGASTVMGAATLYIDYALEGAQNAGVKLAGGEGAMTYAANFDYALDASAFSYGASVAVAAGDMAYAAGYASREGQTSSELTASATYTTEGGATMALAYEADDGASNVVGSSKRSNNALSVLASYSF